MTGGATVTLTVNGSATTVASDPETPLLHVLRNELGLAGPRFGCGVGLCGACFVLLDGRAAPACDTPLWSVEGKTVVTVEGLADGDDLHPLQQAFLDEQAAQCAFCVSGVLVSAAALLAEKPAPTEAEVVGALDRNLCRCGVQRRMVRAVLRAAEQ
ncbi:MAG TPA: (2Fe-2S)-binding protein [Actinomycetes bacterium]|nr:(2Fe-2S)-binding protein [Actinomycetes bacterium]